MEYTEVVAALIRDGNKFLICRRPAFKKRALLWEFVGGKVELGEAKEEALVRECREELCIEIRPLSVFAVQTHNYPDMNIRLTIFNAVIESGNITLTEHTDFKWITPSEIPLYDFCPADMPILKIIAKQGLSAEHI